MQQRLIQRLASRLPASHERTRKIGGHPSRFTLGFLHDWVVNNRLRIESETDRHLPVPIRLSLLEHARPLSRSMLGAVAIKTDGMLSRIAPVIPIDRLGPQPFQITAGRLTEGDASGFLALASLVRDTTGFDGEDREIDLQAEMTLGSAELPEFFSYRPEVALILSDLSDLDSTFLTMTTARDGESAMRVISRMASSLSLRQFQASDESQWAEMLSDVQGLTKRTTPSSAFVKRRDVSTWTPVALPEPMWGVGVVLASFAGMRPRHKEP
ncbi:MAG: hypothetical protein AAF328_11080 [Planctomycetota bacterium]